MENNQNNFDDTITRELDDSELKQIVDGVSVGDRIRMDMFSIVYCSNCGKLIGTVVKFRGINSRGGEVYFVKMDCCSNLFPSGLSTRMTVL